MHMKKIFRDCILTWLNNIVRHQYPRKVVKVKKMIK